jgi:hypothetical protein
MASSGMRPIRSRIMPICRVPKRMGRRSVPEPAEPPDEPPGLAARDTRHVVLEGGDLESPAARSPCGSPPSPPMISQNIA